MKWLKPSVIKPNPIIQPIIPSTPPQKIIEIVKTAPTYEIV